MKKSIATIALFLAFTFAYAQGPSAPEPPASPSTSISSGTSKRSVKISVNKNRKLNLNINDEQFDMKLTFPKKYVKEFRKAFLSNFKNTGDNDIWNGDGEKTSVKIRKNKINIHFLKDEIKAEELDKIKSFAEAILDQLEWDVESMGLWEYSGDWSLANTPGQQ